MVCLWQARETLGWEDLPFCPHLHRGFGNTPLTCCLCQHLPYWEVSFQGASITSSPCVGARSAFKMPASFPGNLSVPCPGLCSSCTLPGAWGQGTLPGLPVALPRLLSGALDRWHVGEGGSRGALKCSSPIQSLTASSFPQLAGPSRAHSLSTSLGDWRRGDQRLRFSCGSFLMGMRGGSPSALSPAPGVGPGGARPVSSIGALL